LPESPESFDKLKMSGIRLRNTAFHAVEISWGNLRPIPQWHLIKGKWLQKQASLLTPSPVVGEGWGEGVSKYSVLADKTLSLTLPHDRGRGPEHRTAIGARA
jgi:hypothetical protein